MAKILTDAEMGQIVWDATHKPEMIDCADAYRHFLEDLGELIANHFGGVAMVVSEADSDLSWTHSFAIDECVPADGGVFAAYDTDVVWKDGKETEAT